MDKKIAVIGGGTGQGNLLRGLKKYTKNISAIVTVADDGGGSGLIRTENRMLPPGDIRNCLLALSETDELTNRLLRHRFESGSIKNQNFGNLLILAYFEIFGDFEKSINYVGESIGIKGRVVPSTMEHVRLVANLENENVAIGESNIASMAIAQKTRIKKLELLPSSTKATASAVDAIQSADVIIIGPGSLYTSIIANLLIPEIAEAVRTSQAKKMFVCNIMTEHGETDYFSSLDHMDTILQHAPGIHFDYILINSQRIGESVREQYEDDHKFEVLSTPQENAEIEKRGTKVICADMAKVTEIGHIIHDTDKVAKIIFDTI